MALSIGLVGLPNVGKSTLFNALTHNQVLAANYPFATIEPNVGVVGVPDPRLARLAALYGTPKVVPATVRFVDIAGLVQGASEGQGLGNQFLGHIRECDAICQVVRGFTDPNVTHVDGAVDPAADIATITTELVLADIQAIDRRLGKVGKDASQRELAAALGEARAILDSGRTLLAAGFAVERVQELQLLSAKPFIYVFNVDESSIGDAEQLRRFQELVAPANAIMLCAQLEASLSELAPAEASELLQELGQEWSGLEQLIRVGQRALGLQSFLTAGPKEVRAWTIPVGATAPQAAGAIHTDFEKGFIRVEVVSYEDLIGAGSLAAARAAGKARLEGRDYVMQPSDVVEFRFNV